MASIQRFSLSVKSRVTEIGAAARKMEEQQVRRKPEKSRARRRPSQETTARAKENENDTEEFNELDARAQAYEEKTKTAAEYAALVREALRVPDDASTLVAYPRAPSVSDIFVDLAPTLREEEAAEDETHIWEPSAPPGVALVDEPDAPYLASILAPSAPLEVAPPLVTEDTSQRHTQRRVATLALPGSVLESIFPLTGSSVHAQEWVKEFQGLADPIGQEIMTFEDGYRESKGFPGKKDIYEETRDEFLDNLCVYEMAFFEHERLKLQSDALQKQLEGTARRVWVLQTRTETFQAICQDGVKLTHHFASESATLDSKTFSELTTLLTGLHEENHSLSVDALFRSKRARIWIQNYLDSWMAQSSLMSSYSNLHVPNEEVTQHKTSLSFLAPTPPASSDRQRIHILLHILFHFEKRHQGKNDSGIASAPILEDYGFVKDVRGWITYLIAGFLPYMSFKDARLILLHVLRCRGIGNWGSSFIQWTVPSQWTDDFIDHYLCSLAALLGPVEELVRVLNSRLASMAFLEKQLRRLESEDWVVVFEEDLSGLPEPTDEETNAEAKTTRPRKKEEFYPTLITQEDYILIWNQFQVTDVFLALIQSFVSDVSNQSMSSQKEYSDILRLFSIAHHTSLIFLRGLHILPKDYTRLRESIASTLILITKTLCQQISQAFNSYPILTLQHQDHITTLQTELDAFVMRQVQHLTKIQGDEVWLHLCSLPFDYLSLSTKIDVGRLLCDLVANCLSESRKISYSCLCSLMDAIVAHFLSKNLTSSPASSNLSSSWAGTNLNMLRKLYDCCFLHPETPISVHIRARDSIIQVTLAFPHWLSSLLPWIRDDFSKLDWNMLVLLLLQMPVEAYEIKSQELSLLLDILKDQDSPLKSRFGMMFLERLNWDYKTNSFQELFLPRQLHRSVAIEMVNLYLDKCHSKDQASLLASVSQKATSTLEKLGITQGDDYKFEVWIWKFILKLKLYQRPMSGDVYVVDSLSSLSKPFIPLESPALSTIRGSMRNNAISAYVAFLVSDIGHQYHVFIKHALDLLHVIGQSGQLESLLHCISHVLPTFKFEPQMLKEAYFKWIAGNLLHAQFSDSVVKTLQSQFDESSCFYLLHPSLSRGDMLFFIRFWHGVILSFGYVSSLGYHILNRISEICFVTGYQQDCQDSLEELYMLRLQAFNDESRKNPGSLPSAIYHMTLQLGKSYPELMPLVDKPNLCPWFAFDAIYVETVLERELRHECGQRLVEYPDLSLSKVITDSSKPPGAFSIFKWAKTLYQTPMSHPILPLYIQAFMFLYFEKPAAGSTKGSFGHLFLKDDMQSLNNVVSKLKAFQRHLLADQKVEHIALFTNAASLWLGDSRLSTGKFSATSLTPDYYPQYFSQLDQGFGKWHLWTDLLPGTSILFDDIHSSMKRSQISSILTSAHKVDRTSALKSSRLGTPRHAPSFDLRKPVLTEIDKHAVEDALQTSLKVVDSMLDKSRSFVAWQKGCKDLDRQYLDQLKILYTSGEVRTKVQKTCGKRCLGPAHFEVSAHKVTIVPEVKQFLTDNRVKLRDAIAVSFIDSKLCIATLASLRRLDLRRYTEDQRKDLLGLFMSLLVKTDRVVFDFLPAHRVFIETFSSFRRAFQTSEDVFLFWSKLLSEDQALLAGHVLKPSLTDDKFPELYSELLARQNKLGDAGTAHLIKQFDVADWLKRTHERHLIKKFLVTVINFPHFSTGVRQTAEANTQLLHTVLRTHGFQTLLVEALRLCYANEISGVGNHDILHEASQAVFPEASGIDLDGFLESLETLSTRYDQFELIGLLSDLSQIVEDTFVLKCKNVLPLSNQSFAAVQNLYKSIACCDKMYKDITDLRREELLRLWSHLILRIMGIASRDSKWQAIYPFKQEIEYFQVSEMVKTLVKIVVKVGLHTDRRQGSSQALWDVLATSISAELPMYGIECLVFQLQRENDWTAFKITNTVVAQCVDWRRAMGDSTILAQLMLHVILNGSILVFDNSERSLSEKVSGSESSSSRDLVSLVLSIVRDIEVIEPNLDARKIILRSLEEKIAKEAWDSLITVEDYRCLVLSVPLEWSCSSKSILTDSANILAFTLHFLRELGKLNSGFTLPRFRIYYTCLFSMMRSHVSSLGSKTFCNAHLDSIFQQMLVYLDGVKDQQALAESLNDLGLKDCVGIMNSVSKESPSFAQLWKGLAEAINETRFPLQYLESCINFASAEAMAFFMEKAIERHVSLCSGPPDWTFLSHSVIFPHMHIERLTKLSLQQSYCHVLHIYALQSLGATPNHDAELLIGEHIAGWLMGLNADGLEFEREGKVALLLAQFAHFLSLEMTHSGDLFGQSRLASLTPSLANLLLKWGEDRVSGGLWATLGFGPKSRFSLEFRFFCRGVGTYIASRCLPTDSPDRTALIGSLEALHSATEYERLVLYLDPLMDEFLLDDTKTLRDLSSVIAHQCRALFPQYVDSSFEVRGY